MYVVTSLDGFIATKDGGIDWLSEIPNPKKSDYGFSAFMSGVDALVMGRNTFDKVVTLSRWPYDRPVFVLSHTLKEIPEELVGKAEIIGGPIKKIVKHLRQRGYCHLYVDGGRVIQSFLEADAIDEMILTQVPILLGDGIPLFGQLSQRLAFRHKNTKVYGNLVQSHYVRDR